MLFRQAFRRARIAWKKLQKWLDRSRFKTEIRRERPEKGTDLGTQQQNTRGEEIGQGNLRVAQPQKVGYVARALDRELEVLWRRGSPGCQA